LRLNRRISQRLRQFSAPSSVFVSGGLTAQSVDIHGPPVLRGAVGFASSAAALFLNSFVFDFEVFLPPSTASRPAEPPRGVVAARRFCRDFTAFSVLLGFVAFARFTTIFAIPNTLFSLCLRLLLRFFTRCNRSAVAHWRLAPRL